MALFYNLIKKNVGISSEAINKEIKSYLQYGN